MLSKRCLLVILALLTCTMSGCANTRIGWPWDYWHCGFWAVIGFLAVIGLILVGLAGVVASLDPEDGDGGMVVGFVVVLLVAGLLLQALPHTKSGVQFVPLPPWHYTSWIARITRPYAGCRS